jgi:hypothetical protein
MISFAFVTLQHPSSMARIFISPTVDHKDNGSGIMCFVSERVSVPPSRA